MIPATVAPASGIGVKRTHIEPSRKVREERAGDRGPGGNDIGVIADGMRRAADELIELGRGA